HQLQKPQLEPAEMRAAIVNIGHLRTKAADINWEFLQPRKRPRLPAEFMKHRKHFLGFAQGENGNERAAAACESTVNPVGQTALFSGACPTDRRGVIASRCRVITLTELCKSVLPISAVVSVMKMRAFGRRRISTGNVPMWS